MTTAERVAAAIAAAEQLQSQISPGVLALQGMSSPRVRHLLNNLCNHPGTRYLEVGVWAGSTLISALFGNQANVLAADAIDNFSQFEGTAGRFLLNCRAHLQPDQVRLHRSSFRDVPPTLTPLVNTYFYDGDHSCEDQYANLQHFWPCLADEFVLLVDDWNWLGTREPTHQAIGDLGGRVLQSWELPARDNGDLEQWWNGLFVAVIQKGPVCPAALP